MITNRARFPFFQMVLLGWWPSFAKVFFYRLRGYKIDRGVRVGIGSVIVAEDVSIGKDVRIGMFSFIRGTQVVLGNRVQVGAFCAIDTPRFRIGDDSKINEQVYVGGLQFPDSTLSIGRNCQIMQMTFINPTCEITIGDDTGIGGDSLLFGHSSWLNRFEGYPVEQKPIHIGKSVSLAWRVFVGAGSKIGDGAVIGANSFVNGSIPSNCLATGTPAKVVGRAPYFPRQLSNEDKKFILHEIVTEMIGYLNGSGVSAKRTDNTVFVEWKTRGFFASSQQGSVRIVDEPWGETTGLPGPSVADVVVSLHPIPADVRVSLDRSKAIWIDIESKERSDSESALGEEVAGYFRRHGLRCIRVPATD